MKELDLKVACQVAGDGQGTTFDKYCFYLRRQAELRDDRKQKKLKMYIAACHSPFLNGERPGTTFSSSN